MNRYQKAYYQAFVASMLICWSPFNALAYLTPILALVWIILATRSSLVVGRVLLLGFTWASSIVLHALFVQDFAFHSALLSILTYGSFAMVAVIPTRWLASSELFERMLRLVRWIIPVEAIWGLVQAGYGYSQTGSLDISNGDFVEGTIHPALAAELSFSNPMFAANMAFLLLALFPSAALEKKDRALFILGAVALIVASVIHVLLLLAVSLALAMLIYRPLLLKRKTGCLIVAGLLLLAMVAFSILRTNLGHVRVFARGIVQGKYPRSWVTVAAAVDMPKEYPLMPLFGLGPGQFSSRAGLIGTGLYFGSPRNPRPLPLLPQGMSKAFRDHVLDIWLEMSFDRPRGYGSTVKPFYSWLSVYTEMGAPALLGVFILAGTILLRAKARAHSYRQRILAISLGTGVLLILLLGIQENYWEVSQAIFPGLLLIKVLYARIVHRGPSPKPAPVTGRRGCR